MDPNKEESVCKHCGKQSVKVNRLMLLAIVVLTSTILYLTADSNHAIFLPFTTTTTSSSFSSPPPTTTINTSQFLQELNEDEDVRLERILKDAATEDKTVIVTTLNAPWAQPDSMIDIFLESFRSGEGTADLVNHLIIVALDMEAYGRCRAIHQHCFALSTQGIDYSHHEPYKSDVYNKMMWRRNDLLRVLLQKGYSFIFSDADITWFRNPFQQFNDEADFQTACDNYNGDPKSVENYANGGFAYVKANNRTVEFYKFWYSQRSRYPGDHDQDVLNRIKYDPYLKEIGINMWFLDTDYFSDLCQPTKALNKVCTMHSNCCLLGLDAKLHDLRIMLEDWSTYKQRVMTDKKDSKRYSWSLLKMKCG